MIFKILVNATNIHAGGGVQVATSFIDELSMRKYVNFIPDVWVSSEIHANLIKLGCDFSNFNSYEVIDVYGFRNIDVRFRGRLCQFDVVFTIFGPLYVWNLKGVNITGFAQPWIVYPNNELYRAMSFFHEYKTRLKYWVQCLFFRRADRMLVELEHVRARLLAKGMGTEPTIDVVHNCLSTIYIQPRKWQTLVVPSAIVDIKLGFVGRNYHHKNTHIFPAVVKALRRDHGISACIYVTFTDEEWLSCDEVFRASVINVGPLYITQCPTFYSRMDAVIFPSLLECFSATPLEAMAMCKPLFASDRPFNRDVCHEHAHYFDPLSPESAANAIARVFKQGGPSPEALKAAREHALNFSNPKERAEKYVAILMQCLQDKKI